MVCERLDNYCTPRNTKMQVQSRPNTILRTAKCNMCIYPPSPFISFALDTDGPHHSDKSNPRHSLTLKSQFKSLMDMPHYCFIQDKSCLTTYWL